MYDISVLPGPNNSTSQGIGLSSEGDYVAGSAFFENEPGDVDVTGVTWHAGRNAFSFARNSQSHLQAVNNRAEAVGARAGDNLATQIPVLVRDRRVYDLPPTLSIGSMLTGITNLGRICGFNHNTRKSFVYDSQTNEIIHSIDPLPGQTWSHAWDLNDKDQVVGSCYIDNLAVTRAFLYDGALKDLGPGFAIDLNNDGMICGGVPTVSPEGWPDSKPVRWDANNPSQPPQDILLPPGFTGGQALGINNQGDVVGYCSAWQRESVFIYYHSEDRSQDLNGLIADPDWQLERAYAINDNGRVTGYGTYRGRAEMAFLLKPQPVPPPRLPFPEIVIPASFEVVVGRALVGGSGWIISLKGGRPPQPVPPREQAWLELTAAKRDALMGLVLDELARSIPDAATRERVRTELLDRVQASLDRLRQSVATRPAAQPEPAPQSKAELVERFARRFAGPRGQAG